MKGIFCELKKTLYGFGILSLL